ncbi:MAG: hypothetical protein JXB04_12485, partial [Kiritimatiellae bacterium]|nr:hypothetical protein [Kiritimatiellia bacterium]
QPLIEFCIFHASPLSDRPKKTHTKPGSAPIVTLQCGLDSELTRRPDSGEDAVRGSAAIADGPVCSMGRTTDMKTLPPLFKSDRKAEFSKLDST